MSVSSSLNEVVVMDGQDARYDVLLMNGRWKIQDALTACWLRPPSSEWMMKLLRRSSYISDAYTLMLSPGQVVVYASRPGASERERDVKNAWLDAHAVP